MKVTKILLSIFISLLYLHTAIVMGYVLDNKYAHWETTSQFLVDCKTTDINLIKTNNFIYRTYCFGFFTGTLDSFIDTLSTKENQKFYIKTKNMEIGNIFRLYYSWANNLPLKKKSLPASITTHIYFSHELK